MKLFEKKHYADALAFIQEHTEIDSQKNFLSEMLISLRDINRLLVSASNNQKLEGRVDFIKEAKEKYLFLQNSVDILANIVSQLNIPVEYKQAVFLHFGVIVHELTIVEEKILGIIPEYQIANPIK